MKQTTNTAPATFADLLRKFEADPRNAENLLSVSRVIALSVLRKVIDPQRKVTAGELDERARGDFRKSVSNSGYNPALLDLRRSIIADTKALSDLATATDAATKATYTPDGDPVTVTADPAADAAAVALLGETLGDGLDLVHTTAAALLEQAADHADGPGWTERPYTVRRLSRRVYIQSADSAAWNDEETTPIQEVFKAVRREIQASRAMRTDPRNGYTYIQELTADPETDTLESVYIRMGKYADIGGFQTAAPVSMAGAPAGLDLSGSELYTADATAVHDYNRMIESLNMTPRQAEIVRLRMQGHGYKAIASKLGISQGNVCTTLSRLREKCLSLGYTPAPESVDTIAENLVRMLFRALEN